MAQRGRRKGSDGELSRALLLRIAADEFAEYGYYETKISNIVKKANVTQPTFYLYFKSKEAIFEELEDLFHMRLASLTNTSRLETNLHEQTLSERIAQGLTRIFRFFTEYPSLGRIGFYISPSACNTKAAIAAQIKDNLLSEVEAGYFHSDVDMSIVANGLVGMVDQLTTTKLWTGEKTADELAKEIVAIMLNGLKK